MPRGESDGERPSVIRDAAKTAAQKSAASAAKPRKRRAKPAARPRPSAPAREAEAATARDPLDAAGWEQEATPLAADDGSPPWDGEGAQPASFDASRTLAEWLEDVIPPEAQTHFISAGREFAAGVQATVEHHLGRSRAEQHRPTRIEIE